MTTKGLPRPTQRGTGTTDLLALTRNPAHRRSNPAHALLFVVFALILATVVSVLSLPRASEIVLTGHTNWVTDVAFSPDSHILATASRDDTVRLWDVASRKPLGDPLTGHTGDVEDVVQS
jgi:WD40 repeat protein